MDVVIYWWMAGLASWKLEVGRVRLEVEKWRSNTEGGRLGGYSGRRALAVASWKPEVGLVR